MPSVFKYHNGKKLFLQHILYFQSASIKVITQPYSAKLPIIQQEATLIFEMGAKLEWFSLEHYV